VAGRGGRAEVGKGSSSGGTGAGSGLGVGGGFGHGSGFGSGVGVGVGVGRSEVCGVGPAPRRSSARSCSRRRAASFAASIASDGLRVFFSDEKPCAIPAASPETFSTGAEIAVETARTAVSALSAIETALSVTVSSLSSW
jgi:hypothetical protein